MKVFRIIGIVVIVYIGSYFLFKWTSICPSWIDLMPKVEGSDQSLRGISFEEDWQMRHPIIYKFQKYFCKIYYPIRKKVY